MSLLLAHLLPFCPLLLHEASPVSSPSRGSSGSSQVTSLPPQASLRLLSLFLPVHHRLPYFFLSGSHLCLCLSGVSLSLATCYQRPCFISPFLLSLKWHKGMGLLGLSLLVWQQFPSFWFEASVFPSVHCKGSFRIQRLQTGKPAFGLQGSSLSSVFKDL